MKQDTKIPTLKKLNIITIMNLCDITQKKLTKLKDEDTNLTSEMQINTRLCRTIKQSANICREEKMDLNDILENSLYNRYIKDINKQINEYNNSDDVSNSYTTVDGLNSIMYKIAELLQMYITTNLKIQPSAKMTIGQCKELCAQLLLPQHKNIDEIFNKIIKQNTTKKITDDSKPYETLGIEKADSKKLQQLWKEGRLYKWIKQLVTYIIIKYFLITKDITIEQLIEILELFVDDDNNIDQEELNKLKDKSSQTNKKRLIQEVLGNNTDKFIKICQPDYNKVFSVFVICYWFCEYMQKTSKNA